MIFKILGRLLGKIFSGIGRGFMGFFRWVGRHEAGLGIVTVAVVAVGVIWLLLSLLNINIVFGDPPSATPVNVPVAASNQATASPTAAVAPAATPLAVTRNNAPAATEAFMTGQVNGNADQVWDAMAAPLHTQLAGSGVDKTYFQRLFASQKQSGVVYESYQYVGGVPDENGGSIHFYVLTSSSGTDKKTSRIPWTFVIDKEGKIISFNRSAGVAG